VVDQTRSDTIVFGYWIGIQNSGLKYSQK
jgi:hypothetical protein